MRGVATEGIRLSRANANRGLFNSSAEIAAARAISGQSGLIQEFLPNFTDQGLQTIARRTPDTARGLLDGSLSPSNVSQQFAAYRLFSNVSAGLTISPNRSLATSLASFFSQNADFIVRISGFPDDNGDIRNARFNTLANFFMQTYDLSDETARNRALSAVSAQVASTIRVVDSGSITPRLAGRNIGILFSALQTGFNNFQGSIVERNALIAEITQVLLGDIAGLRNIPDNTLGFIVKTSLQAVLDRNRETPLGPGELVRELIGEINATVDRTPQTAPQYAPLDEFRNSLNAQIQERLVID
jgi:hypothetical protein